MALKHITKYQKAIQYVVNLDNEPPFVGHAERTDCLKDFVAHVFDRDKDDVEIDVDNLQRKAR